MNNFKKYFALILALALVFTLAACGEKPPVEDPDNTGDPNQGVTPPPSSGNNGEEDKNPNAFDGKVEYNLPDGSATVTATFGGEGYIKSVTNKFVTLLYTEDPEDVTFIRFDYFVGKAAVDVPVDYLDSYIEYDETEAAGTVQIGADGIYAELLTAQNEEQYLESYLADVEGGSVCVIISVSKALKDENLPLMKEVLDTLKIA